MMQKGQKTEEKHAKKLGSGVLGPWMETHNSLITFLLLLLCLFSLFFKTFLLFYSLKSWSLDLHCPMFPLISKITPNILVLRLTDTTAAAPAAAASSSISGSQPPKQPTNPRPPSASLLYTVANKEVEPQFSGRGVAF
jgi:hypothetical protein